MKFKYGLLLLLLCSALIGFITCGDNSTNPNDDPKPKITKAPEVINIRPTSVEVTWETDMTSSSVVKYGTSTGQHTSSEQNNIPAKIHLVSIDNLVPNRTYYFIAQSQNGGGTVSSSEALFITKLNFSDLVLVSWQTYESGNYAEAIGYFEDMLELNPNYPDGYNGLGWCYGSNVIDSLETALENFNYANALNSNFADAVAGRGFVFLALKQYSKAVNDFNRIIQNYPNYVFLHNSTVTISDVRLGLAEASFYRQNYQLAQEQLDLLAPQNGLDSNNSSTWVVDSINYTTYQEALLAWIQKMTAMFSKKTLLSSRRDLYNN